MRIIHVKRAGVLSEEIRATIKNISCQGTENVMGELKNLFPQHVVSAQCGRIQVVNTNGSIFLDLFQDGSPQTDWIETNLGLRMTM